MGWVFRLPEIGERVGDYRIVEKLGSGSYGHVYKAEQAGCFFVVKFLRGRLLHDRARREIRILIHLEHPDVVRFVACGFWPDQVIGHSYIVMEFAGGRTLEVYAQEENPSARRAARIVLDIGLTLGEVLRQGVMHRDLKPDNVIVRDGNARPLLIDFGVGTLVRAPVVTSSRLPPGTIEFRSPEAWHFSRENDSAHYDYGLADELWALGVNFYWLLTDILPFGDREDEEGGGLAERILHQTPIAPHILNPRVPRVLSDICMKMLEKDPAARYASVVEFCAALDAAMAEAEADASWDLPLIEPEAPHNRTIEEDPALVEVNDSMRWLRRWRKEKLRRGQKPPQKAPVPAPVAEVLAAVPEQKAPAVAVVPAPEPVALPAPQAPAPLEARRAAAAPRPPGSRGRARFAVAAGLAVGVFGAFLFARSLSPARVSAPLDTSSEAATTQQAESGREVAQSGNPLDPPGGEGAEPSMGSISAPVMITMLSKDDTREKPQEQKTKVFGCTAKVICTGLVCTTLSGCPTPQVRPTPEPAPCPAGAVETMKTLGIGIGENHEAGFPELAGEWFTVREGDTTLELWDTWGKLPENTRLSGRLIFGDGRVYGRFIEARVPGGGTFKVCLEMRDPEHGGRGTIRKPDGGGGPESAVIFSSVAVRAVRSFE
ncbi:MAG: serine/threonine protein kinase [Archangium sp.]